MLRSNENLPHRDAINFLKEEHNLTVPGNYEINIQRAICSFLSHPVFNPFYLTQVPLYKTETGSA